MRLAATRELRLAGAGADSGVARAQGVALFGTPWVARSDAEGSLILRGIPPGSYTPVLPGNLSMESRIGTTLLLPEGEAHTLLSAVVHFGQGNEIPFHDFNEPRVSLVLEPLHPGGFLWASTTASTDPALLFTREAGDAFLRQANVGEPLTNFGFTAGVEERAWPLDSAVVVRFRARGSGAWSFRVNSLDAAGQPIRWMKELTLGTDWSTLRIPLSDLHAASDTSLHFPGGEQGIPDLYWQSAGPGQIDIDDVWLEGVSLKNWSGL